MTFSIVAADPASGTCGVAIATARPSVGGRCIALRPGVGAAATQAIVNPALGVAVLDLVAAGAAPEDAVAGALRSDPDAGHRQLQVAALDGRTAATTGAEVREWCGHVAGPARAVAGNLLVGPSVVEAAVTAFDEASGDLADRLLAALRAGQQQGGDRRGQESAALVVVGTDPWPVVDLRIDHDPRPVDQLAALLERWRGSWQRHEETGVFPPADPPGPPPVAAVGSP